jgi:outer membrane receptor for ferrienterochelin and colicins
MRWIVGLFALSCAAQGLEVRVLDASGGKVADAMVTARQTLSGGSTACRTDAEGHCSVRTVGPGEYQVTASKDGLTDSSRRVKVHSDRQSLELKLEVASVRASVTVVSGSRIAEVQEESPTKVEVVTREEIQSTGYERVTDVLAEMPGVVTRRTTSAAVGGEQIQGVDSRQVLVLQDGLPVVGARGIKSGALNLNRQSVGRMGRVEVAKGAGSPLYGSDAIGGVINMITREPRNPVEGGLSLSGGSLGAVDFRGDIGGIYKGWSHFLNLETHRQDAYGLLATSPVTVGPEFRRHDFLYKTRWQVLPKLALGFTANAYHNRELGRSLSETGLVNGRSSDSQQNYTGVIDYTLSSHTLWQTRGYLARYDENSVTTPLAGGAESFANLNERLRRLDSTLSHQFGNSHLLQGGMEWAQNIYKGANRLVGDNAGQQVTTNDYWIQDKWQVGSRLTMNLGGRITNHSLFGNAAVPKVGLVYRLSDRWIARAAWGKGFRAPDLGQLYFRFANPASFYQVIGNPNLRPEHGTSYQTGMTYRANRFRGGVTFYRNQIRDLIDSFLTGTPTTAAQLQAVLTQYGIPSNFSPFLGRQTFVYRNLSKIQTEGFELDGEYALNRRVRVAGAYTFLHATDRNAKLALLQRHRHQGYIKVDYANTRWGLDANLRGTFFSHWQLSNTTRGLPYQIWDAYGAKQVYRGTQVFGVIDNLNNSRDGKLQLPTPSFDRPDYGRTWRLGLRYQFARKE